MLLSTSSLPQASSDHQPRYSDEMLKDLEPLLNNLPPKTAQALTQAINKCGRELAMGQEWVQRWVAFTIADALASYAPDGEPAFHLKGGAAIELRMRQLRKVSDPEPGGLRPRATKDLDATYRGALQDLEGAVRAALAEPRHKFAFRVEVETPDAPRMRRFSIPGLLSGGAVRQDRREAVQQRAARGVDLRGHTAGA